MEQKCNRFYSASWSININNGLTKSYYICEINGNLENDQEEVTTDTSLNKKSNAEVTMVQYQLYHSVEFIPNSLFDTFENLEYLVIESRNKFETMKREYLRNANKLKNLWINNNSIKKIDGNVFSEAKSLEYMNFRFNKIESIHREAFNGLPKLQGVYLYYNRIKKLHPETFSLIATLNNLHLEGAKNCANAAFISANAKFPQIEAKISSSCTYEPFPDKVNAIQKLAEEKKIKFQELNDKIGNLTVEAQAKQKKFVEMSNQLEQMKAELSSQQNKQVKELANHQKELTKIASEKLQLQAKITQMEAKNQQLEAKLAIQQKEPQECKSEPQLESTSLQNLIDSKLTQMEAKLAVQKLELLQECKSELQLESTTYPNQIDSKFTQMEVKLTAQKLEHKVEEGKLAGQMMTLQNIYFSLVDRINDQKDWNKKYSDEIGTTCENNLRLVQSRLAFLEKKID